MLLIPSAGYKNVLGDILPIKKQLENEFNCYIAVKDIKKELEFINNDKYVKLNSSTYNYLVLSADYVFDCGQLSSYKKVSKSSKWINLWHGIPIKKMMLDIGEFPVKIIPLYRYYDHFVSSSKYYSNILKNSFLYEGNILEIGTPRYDLIYSKNNNNLRSELSIPKENKVILYAPTFRKKGKIRLNFDFDSIQRQFDENVTILVKAHYLNKIDKESLNENIIDVTDYNTLNDLFDVCDLLITDYSSLLFDYSLYNKPLILYHYDYEEYKQSRGFYFELKDFFNDIAYSERELYDLLGKDIKTEYSKFIEKFLPLENGHSTDKLLQKLEMNSENYTMKEVIFLVNQLNEVGGVHTFIKQTSKLLKDKERVKIVVIATTTQYSTNKINVKFDSPYIDTLISNGTYAKEYLQKTDGFIISTQVYAQIHFQNYLKNKNVILMFHGDVKFANNDKDVYSGEITKMASGKIFNMKSIALLTKSNKEYFDNIQSKPIRTVAIPNYVEEDVQSNLTGNAIFLSRLTEADKNIFALIDVAKCLKEMKSNIKIDIYGIGTDKEELIKRINENNLEDILIYKGYTTKPIQEFKNHKIHIVLSKTEGLPYTVLEAASVGVPTIAFDTFLSAKDIIHNSLLIKEGSINEFAQVLDDVLSNKEKINNISNIVFNESKGYNADQIYQIWKNEFATIEKISAEPKTKKVNTFYKAKVLNKIKNYLQNIVNSNYRSSINIPTTSKLKKIKHILYFMSGFIIDHTVGSLLKNKYFLVNANKEIYSFKQIKSMIKEEELVSIIVPAYNVEKTVKKTIYSLLKQDYSNIEIVAVDDGSTDNTLKVLNEFNDKRVRIYTKENDGLSGTRNFALEKVKGSYVLFVDGDDTLQRDAVKNFYYHMKFFKVNIVSAKTLRVKVNKFNLLRGTFWRKETYRHPYVTNIDTTNNLINDALCTNKMYDISIFKKHKLSFEKLLYEDKIFTSQLYNTNESILILNKHVYNWFVYQRDTLSSTVSIENLNSRMHSVKRQLEIIDNIEVKKILVKNIISHDMIIYIKKFKNMSLEEQYEYFEIFYGVMKDKWHYIDFESRGLKSLHFLLSKYLKEGRRDEFIKIVLKTYT